ncbi:hypothetical protein QCM77_34430 [Bradyrhizobium sp. SSUT18]|uniref:hypothetical protein n=1 Tax=Bradyrhizobium sp. SSUT18 TaxID=3040602 RepID=UPI00244723FF|nr:hypothetical protein [Bradyrhizobium sp. SSUT18]MDH2404980.1 hypothetical protein [Bradyrhizobium sp. SSUT18]
MHLTVRYAAGTENNTQLLVGLSIELFALGEPPEVAIREWKGFNGYQVVSLFCTLAWFSEVGVR